MKWFICVGASDTQKLLPIYADFAVKLFFSITFSLILIIMYILSKKENPHLIKFIINNIKLWGQEQIITGVLYIAT